MVLHGCFNFNCYFLPYLQHFTHIKYHTHTHTHTIRKKEERKKNQKCNKRVVQDSNSFELKRLIEFGRWRGIAGSRKYGRKIGFRPANQEEERREKEGNPRERRDEEKEWKIEKEKENLNATGIEPIAGVHISDSFISGIGNKLMSNNLHSHRCHEYFTCHCKMNVTNFRNNTLITMTHETR